MYNIYLSLAVAAFMIFFPMAFGVSIIWTFIPGIALGVLAFYLIARSFAKKIEGSMSGANQDLQSLQQVYQQASTGQLNQEQFRIIADAKINRAVEHFKKTLAFSKWQFGLDISIHAQIGMLIFAHQVMMPKGDLMKSFDDLEKSMVKGPQARLFASLWQAWARLAVCYFKIKQDLKKTEEIMEVVVNAVPKEGFAWSIYAWFFWKANKQEDALSILARGVALSNDPILKENWHAVQNNLPMNMNAYGQNWFALGLEKPKQQAVQQGSPLFANPKILNKGMRR
jgi:hypothetical protein